MLNRVPAFMCGDAQSCYRRRVVNVARQVQLFLGRVVMIAQDIVRLHDVDIMNVPRLQDLACAFGTVDVPAGADLAPSAKRAGYPHLRPNSNDQRDADVEQPVGTETKTGRTADIRQAARAQYKAQ